MSKEYNLFCGKHGRIKLEIEKPPLKFTTTLYCPFCLNRLAQPDKDAQKKWEPNYVAEGAKA